MDYLQHIDLLSDRALEIRRKINAVCEASHLSKKPPEIIAVSKGQPLEKIKAACEMGHLHFGENKVQEAQGHFQDLKSHYPNITLHLIGPLQSNKTAEAVALFDVIHTIDRLKIAESIKKESDKQNKEVPCFIQINTGEEAQKSGVSPQEADRFIAQCKNDIGLTIVGLMCIPPLDQNPAPHFALLQQMAERNGLTELSMGMSKDYDLATRLGATYVRVGTHFFGERNQS